MPSSTYRAILLRVSIAILSYPCSALAEVSDKEPTASLFWTVGIGAALLCLFGTRIKPWLGVTVLALAVLWFVSVFLEIHSSDVSPHLEREQGAFYYWQAYAAFGTVLCGFVVGYVWHRRITS